jgi:cytochrome b pre-mRNA-processing protein 3
MILKRLFARKPDVSQSLYEAIVAAARQQKFYAEWAVPDTVDGRFDMISLHLFLVLERLKAGGTDTQDVRQRLTNCFFLDMDRSLREMGVGDLSVGKKVRKMAEAFYGRVAAYSAALEPGGDVEAVLRRNVFPDAPQQDVTALAAWVKAARSHLATQDVMAGGVNFP